MNPITKSLLIKTLKETLFKVENDECGLDDDESAEMTHLLLHRKLNIEQMCKHVNASRATLNRMIVDERIPKPRKDAGGNKYWYQDEVDNYIAAYKRRYNCQSI